MYYEIDENRFVKEIGIGNKKGYEISAERYNAISESFRYCPMDTETYTHRLNIDIEWEAVPIGEIDPDIDDTEALNIILGEE